MSSAPIGGTVVGMPRICTTSARTAAIGHEAKPPMRATWTFSDCRSMVTRS